MLLCGGEQDDLYIYDLYSSQPNKLYQKLILSEEEGIVFDDRVWLIVKGHIVDIQFIDLDSNNIHLCITTDMGFYMVTTSSYVCLFFHDSLFLCRWSLIMKMRMKYRILREVSNILENRELDGDGCSFFLWCLQVWILEDLQRSSCAEYGACDQQVYICQTCIEKMDSLKRIYSNELSINRSSGDRSTVLCVYTKLVNRIP